MKKSSFVFILILVLNNHVFLAQNFYDISKIQKIEISFSQANWDYILDTAKQGGDSYTLSQWVKINGVKFDSAGVKYKGRGSYNPNNLKNSLHIELDHFKVQNYLGYKDIKLNNGWMDPSFLRETFLYSIFQNYAEASHANYAQTIINGQYMGLYTNVEAVTKTFLADRFYSNNHVFVFGDETGCTLKYKGNDSALYYTPYTMKSDYGWTKLMRFCDSLKNNIPNIENVLDVDRTLWLHAFTNVFVILDSYIGSQKHNYYIYEDHNGRFNPIIWDLNGGLGGYDKSYPTGTLTVAQRQTLNPMIHANDSMWPLIKSLFTVPMFQRMYIAHMKTIVDENLANNSYFTFLQYLQSIADTAAFSDPNKFFTYAQFQSNLNTDVSFGSKQIPGISSLMNARLAYLNSTTEFQQIPPTLTGVAATNTAPVMNSTVYITANVSGANAVYIGKRNSIMDRFRRYPMFDDGLHGDGAASDGVYGVEVIVNTPQVQYYVYAENNNAGIFSPQRAEHEYYTIKTLGSPAPGMVVINEFLAANQSKVTNEFNLYEDWIELYNNSGNPVNLAGYYLSDNFSNKTKFGFAPNTIIQPGGYLIVWADGYPTSTVNIHANFKLNNAGEQIMLSDGLNIIIDSLTYGPQTADVSNGRCPDGTGSIIQLAQPSYSFQNCPVGVEEKSSEERQIQVWPNPASQFLNIQWRGAAGIKTIRLMDISGRKILEEKFNSFTQIDVGGLSPGAYLICVGNEGEPFQAIKFIKPN